MERNRKISSIDELLIIHLYRQITHKEKARQILELLVDKPKTEECIIYNIDEHIRH